jgi:hypothetical protein
MGFRMALPNKLVVELEQLHPAPPRMGAMTSPSTPSLASGQYEA